VGKKDTKEPNQTLTRRRPMSTKKGKGKQVVKKLQKKLQKNRVEQYDPAEDHCQCLVCGESFAESNSGEDWIQCTNCMQWSHELCTGIECQQIDYKCDSCANASD